MDKMIGRFAANFKGKKSFGTKGQAKYKCKAPK